MQTQGPTPGKRRRTWLWILVAVFGLGVVCVIAIAGFGMYFVSTHVSTKALSPAEAFKAFDVAKAPFKDQPPLFEMDDRERITALRQLSDLPAAKKPAEHMYVLVWSAEKEKLVKLSLPFWVLRLGRQKIDVGTDVFDMKRMDLDIKQLERAGSLLVLDHRDRTGQRVLIWTQ
jgi:hypothetical protein